MPVASSALAEHLAWQSTRLGRSLKPRIRLRGLDAVCRMVESRVAIAVVSETAATRCRRTMAFNTLRLTDTWAVRQLIVCVRRKQALPAHTRRLVEHLAGTAKTDAYFAKPHRNNFGSNRVLVEKSAIWYFSGLTSSSNDRFAPEAVTQQPISCLLLPYQSRTDSVLCQTLSNHGQSDVPMRHQAVQLSMVGRPVKPSNAAPRRRARCVGLGNSVGSTFRAFANLPTIFSPTTAPTVTDLRPIERHKAVRQRLHEAHDRILFCLRQAEVPDWHNGSHFLSGASTIAAYNLEDPTPPSAVAWASSRVGPRHTSARI